MPLVLVRIDDRLIHGQVVAGWGLHLSPNRIILSSDNIATSDWEKEMYIGAEVTAPYPLTISVLTLDETIEFLTDNILEKEKIILIIETPHETVELVKKGLQVERINVGGMHYQKGKRQIAPFIFVDEHDIFSFRELTQMNIHLEGRDVPTAKSIDILPMIDSLKW